MGYGAEEGDGGDEEEYADKEEGDEGSDKAGGGGAPRTFMGWLSLGRVRGAHGSGCVVWKLIGIGGRMGDGAVRDQGGDEVGTAKGGDKLTEGGLVLCFAAAGIDILCAAPAEGDAVDPLSARDPERVNGQVMHVVGQAKFILDVRGFAGFFGGNQDNGVRFANGVAQGGLPVRGTRSQAGLIDPDCDAAALQVSDEALDE